MSMHVEVSTQIRLSMGIQLKTETHDDGVIDLLQKTTAEAIKSSTRAKAVLVFDQHTSEHKDGVLHATIVCLSFPLELWATILSMAQHCKDPPPTMLSVWVVKDMDANEFSFGSEPPQKDAVAAHNKNGDVRPAHVTISVRDFEALGAQ